MATMWPRKLPPDITTNTLRSTECRVYHRLESVLENPFVVFYSRPWLGMRPDGEEIDGECDFVVAHPDLGILTVEVKGGAVSYYPEDNQWTSKDRWGYEHNIKNPVNQARVSKHQILNKLKMSRLWTPKRIRARHCVILPDSSKPVEDLGADMPLNIICFLEDFDGDFKQWILDRFGDPSEHDSRELPLGNDGIKALENLLAHPFQLHVPLGKILHEDDREINFLTQQQFHILKAIEDNRWVAISGGAGTGKTVLAMEEAKRCADDGMRVLYTCYNRPLALDIQRRIGHHKGLSIATFHEFCFEVANKSGLKIMRDRSDDKFFNETLPDILHRSLKTLPELRFDAIIVDEGQDFLPHWWTVLIEALDTNGKGLLRVFYDSNQRVYGSMTVIPVQVKRIPIKLTRNLRNTRRIHQEAQKFYRGFVIEPMGPEGVEIDWIESKSLPDMRDQIENNLLRLINNERVNPSNIAVLAANEHIINELAPRSTIININGQSCDTAETGYFIIDTIRRFKGLESQVVILAVTPDLVTDEEMIYVALSRARTHLIVIGDTPSLQRIRT